ncbi:hypothetical protein LTR85_011567 [Meristemomyces frigidus]|nr:hypothetical protein LTR85_011567 [Meristemomyces frigidus]
MDDSKPPQPASTPSPSPSPSPSPPSPSKSLRTRPLRLINATTRVFDPDATRTSPYAILSHTWGQQKEEVLYRDVRNGVAQQKSGCAKIDGTCKQADQDSLELIWVDTACIDKESSSELDEAINSMYAWYQGAAVCYVLLSDVPGGFTFSVNSQLDGEQDESNRVQITESLRASRWFTRGWTLQELLAPTKVEFFARDWSFLGTLSDLLPFIAEITGIPTPVLAKEKPLAECSTAQKLSWASARETTRPEDAAYCLFGMLDVQMPLLYGETMQKAFLRLQAASLTKPRDLSILAWDQVDDERRTHLLASSPRDFRGCGAVALERRVSQPAEYWATNLGLKGTLSVLDLADLEGQSGRVLVSLECHYEDAPEETLGLHVVADGSLPTCDSLTVSVCAVGKPTGSLSTLSRLGRINFFEYADTRRMDMTILTEGSEVTTTRSPGGHNAKSFVVPLQPPLETATVWGSPRKARLFGGPPSPYVAVHLPIRPSDQSGHAAPAMPSTMTRYPATGRMAKWTSHDSPLLAHMGTVWGDTVR